MECSVVQGSKLGGTLFDVFIDDIDDATSEAFIEILHCKFADVTKVAQLIQSLDDAKKFQQGIDKPCYCAKNRKWLSMYSIKA